MPRHRLPPHVALLSCLAIAGCAPPAEPPAVAPAGDAAAEAAAATGDTAAAATPADDGAPLVVPTTDGLLDSVVRADDTLASLRERYGAENVLEQALPAGEGDTIGGWRLFPGRPGRELNVYLDETGMHPAMLVAGAEVVDWQRADGVRNGLTVAELAALNGSAFTFMGFDWDFGGVVIDWRGGRLGPGGTVPGPVTLCAPAFAGNEHPDGWPLGDGEFDSGLAVLAEHPPRVCEFGLVVAQPPET